MKFYSTNKSAPEVTLAEALLMGQAPDKGLYLPRHLPHLSQAFLRTASQLTYPELAAKVLSSYADTFTEEEMLAICTDAYDFDIPIEHVTDRRHILRLDRGPSASFKDFAARFMGRAIGRLVARENRELLILTATSGDTGSAVAHAFLGVPGIKVLVLFPRDEVSDRQRKQMTTLGDNVAMISVDGKFDDCQALVKRAFADPDLTALNLSSANSINIGRLLPQSVYYIYAAAQIADIGNGEKVLICVPSGNFGNLMGAVLAFKCGLPVEKFVVATNANDEVPLFIESGSYQKIEPSRVCISNAMNVGHPSNLARLVDLYGGHLDETGQMLKQPDMAALKQDFFAVSISDDLTRKTIDAAYKEHGVLLEPHGAVGFAGLNQYLEVHPEHTETPMISLETAHPAKFPDEVRNITGVEPPVPACLEGLEEKPEAFDEMRVDYDDFKSYLERKYR
ncbi:MAG: threonine synthase [Deltaproteobacteria bacterium]|nr:threonine synthase [Deltaproteobacteria bacterium]MBN2674383.1 threonine synthase [Deltaproteobacteria bacterium]